MRFPLEVVGDSKKNITRRIHIKYVDNMDLKTETDDLNGKILKNLRFKKMTLKMDFRCESSTPFKQKA
jgi:hypothetical protein